MENPITREEKILNDISSGEDLGFEPITREEMYLAHLAGIGKKPEKPITRKEMFLDKIELGSGGDSVTINNQDKTITENGTYTADEGYTGLGTVTVDVQSAGGGEASVLNSLIDRSITEVSSNVTTIGAYAFMFCNQLTSVNLTNAELARDSVFRYCTQLKDVNLPSLTQCQGYLFSNCTSLSTITLPSLKTVGGSDMFKECTSLMIADLPSLQQVYATMFADCTSLSVLIFRSETMCTLMNTACFNRSAIANGTGYIYVPRALVDTYKSATNWSTYATQFRALEDYTVDGTITGELDPEKI